MRQESLSPDDKVWILMNDAAAHKKQRESLPPDDKVQILTNNAAEQKNTESLYLLNKKLKLSQLIRLRTKNNMSCFRRRKKLDSWKPSIFLRNNYVCTRRKFPMYKKKILIQQENLHKINFPTTTKKWHNRTTVLYTKSVRNTKNYFLPEQKKLTQHHNYMEL